MKHPELRNYIEKHIFPELSPDLYYHSAQHTIDVYQSALRICDYEKTDLKSTDLIASAALLHDIGYIREYLHNEPIACEMSKEILERLGYSEEEHAEICTLILATKVPQKPLSHAAEILCDADLDYLGRDDFESGGQRLFHEFKDHGIVKNEAEWNLMQIKFLSVHTYFTEFSNLYREPEKQKHLQKLKNATLS